MERGAQCKEICHIRRETHASVAVQSTGYALVPESHGVEPLDPRIPVDPINHQRLSHGQTGGPFLAEGLQYLVA